MFLAFYRLPSWALLYRPCGAELAVAATGGLLRRLQVAQLWAIMVQSDSRTLEGKAHAQHAVVIEGVKAGYSNLFACAHRQA